MVWLLSNVKGSCVWLMHACKRIHNSVSYTTINLWQQCLHISFKCLIYWSQIFNTRTIAVNQVISCFCLVDLCRLGCGTSHFGNFLYFHVSLTIQRSRAKRKKVMKRNSNIITWIRVYNKNWGLVEQLLGGDYTDMVLALENQCVLVMYASQGSGFIVYNIRDCDVQKCNKEQR